jgi:hypothetical protein
MLSSMQTGSEANCTKPICCRNFADQTGPVEVAAGPLGSHGCDTPGTLSQSMLKAVAAENTRFSIFTGDVVEGKIDTCLLLLFLENILHMIFSSGSLAGQSDVSVISFRRLSSYIQSYTRV